MNKAFEEVPCNLCGSTQAEVLYQSTLPQDLSLKVTKRFAPSDHVSGNDRVVRCTRCGLIYVSPRMKREFVWQGYSEAVDTKYATQTEGRLATFQRAVRMIEGYVQKRGKLLDVGCAAGFFLKVAKDAGWDVAGIEPNRGLAKWGSREYGVPISTKDFLKSDLPAESFDVVTFWDVLEHVTDPRAYVREATRALKPGGFLFVNYPDMGSIYSKIFKQKWWFISPVHLYYFDRRTLAQYFEAEGLKFIKQNRHWQTLALGYLFTRFEGYSEPLARLGQRVVNALGLKNFPMRYWAGQAVAIAKKI
jgi:2-polyprenyl-3-methyl-5-hydroxy-6-metoxy-1,4-benzoquinol methylase